MTVNKLIQGTFKLIGKLFLFAVEIFKIFFSILFAILAVLPLAKSTEEEEAEAKASVFSTDSLEYKWQYGVWDDD